MGENNEVLEEDNFDPEELLPVQTAPQSPYADRVLELQGKYVRKGATGKRHMVLGVYTKPDGNGGATCDALLLGHEKVPCEELLDEWSVVN